MATPLPARALRNEELAVVAVSSLSKAPKIQQLLLQKINTRYENRVSWRGSRFKRCTCGSHVFVFVYECPVGFPRYVSWSFWLSGL